MKTAFRVVQNSGEVEELEHGDKVAIYRESEDSGYRNSSRWVKLGTYDTRTDNIISEYMLTYEPGRKKFSGQLEFSEKGRDSVDGKIVPVTDEIYKSALDELHNHI